MRTNRPLLRPDLRAAAVLARLQAGFTRLHLPGPALALLAASLLVTGCHTFLEENHLAAGAKFSRLVKLERFDAFRASRGAAGGTVWTSPVLPTGLEWNQLVVSWNWQGPPETVLRFEAAAVYKDHETGWFNLGDWSRADAAPGRTSHSGPVTGGGRVKVDTLELARPATAVRVRLTVAGGADELAGLKQLALDFADVRTQPPQHPARPEAWGKVLPVPQYCQHGWPGAHGWCSPTSVAMVLGYWSQQTHRADLAVTVPTVAAAVYDHAYAGTGNWSFNAAYAGGFPGMRALVTRFDNLSEVESWIATGVPVVLSTRWDELQPGRPSDPDGHLIVCAGFTRDGDVVVNDPAAPAGHAEAVRKIYRRQDVIRAWRQSHHAVYLIYPEGQTRPADQWHHW